MTLFRFSSISFKLFIFLSFFLLVFLEGPHDVRVRMKAVGICGSDVHYLKVKPS